MAQTGLQGVDMQNYRGSRIRNFRAPAELDRKIDQFTKRSGWDAATLIRTALEEFFAKRPPGDKVAPKAKAAKATSRESYHKAKK